MKAGDVVPTGPLCEIKNIPVFRVGFWRGIYHPAWKLKELVDNFRKFSTGPESTNVPGSINHHDILATGRVKDVRFDGATLFVDMADVDLPAAQWWNSGQLQAPSIEYWDTRENMQHRLTAGFRLPDGKPPGLVLKAVTLCGNQSPAVKGLGTMPKAVFQQNFNDSAEPWRFNSEDFMDKATLIASLKTADPSLTDAFLGMLSDDQLASLMDAKQGAAAGAAVDVATPGAGAPPGGAPTQMGDMTDPAQMVGAAKKMFADASEATASIFRLRDQAAKENEQVAAIRKTLLTEQSKRNGDRVTEFVNSPEFQQRVPPVQRPAVEKMLRKCDTLTVRKFSDNSTTGSELDEEIALIKKNYPVDPRLIRKFSDQTDVVQQPGGGETPSLIAIRVASSTPESAHIARSIQAKLDAAGVKV